MLQISAHPPVWAQSNGYRPWALFRETTVWGKSGEGRLLKYRIRLMHTLLPPVLTVLNTHKVDNHDCCAFLEERHLPEHVLREISGACVDANPRQPGFHMYTVNTPPLRKHTSPFEFIQRYFSLVQMPPYWVSLGMLSVSFLFRSIIIVFRETYTQNYYNLVCWQLLF